MVATAYHTIAQCGACYTAPASTRKIAVTHVCNIAAGGKLNIGQDTQHGGGKWYTQPVPEHATWRRTGCIRGYLQVQAIDSTGPRGLDVAVLLLSCHLTVTAGRGVAVAAVTQTAAAVAAVAVQSVATLLLCCC